MMRTVIMVALGCVLLVGVASSDKHSKGSGDSVDSKGGSFRSGVIASRFGLFIGGIQSFDAPFALRNGKASLTPSGDLRLEIKGLLLPDGTTGPVTQISASVVCGGSGGMVVATTPEVDLSAEGDAKLEAKITPPATCFGTIILVRLAGLNGKPSPIPFFIAVTGFDGQA